MRATVFKEGANFCQGEEGIDLSQAFSSLCPFVSVQVEEFRFNFNRYGSVSNDVDN